MHIHDDWNKSFTKAYTNTIGNGAFGDVWLVRSKVNGRFFAMKGIDLNQYILKCSLINKAYALDEGLKLRQLGIKHPNICKYYKSFIFDESIYWIMEYCDGGTLKERLSLYMKQEIRIEEDLIWYWSLHILNGLKHLHDKGLIHRDLKPDNIFISLKNGLCKIGDFGLSKILIDASLNETTSVKFLKFPEETENNNIYSDLSTKKNKNIENSVVYKLINLSQVGTPSYMSFEMRDFIEAHLNHYSIDSVQQKLRICEKNIYKGDIFSFGCILYEMIFLSVAFENSFLLQDEAFRIVNKKINEIKIISSDLKRLMNLTITKKPESRYNTSELFKQEMIQSRLKNDYFHAYKNQIIPRLNIFSKFAKQNVLDCIKVELYNNYKPATMKTLKFNQNLIVIVANKHVNMQTRNTSFKAITSTLNNLSPFNVSKNIEEAILEEDDYFEEAMIFIYNEYGQLIKEFESFMLDETTRESLNFQVYDLCVDEENDHLYLSTKQYGILRFKIKNKNFYFEDILFDGRIDLNELFIAQNMNKCKPTCLNLIENENHFSDSMKSTGKRRLIFNDRFFNRIIIIQVDLISEENPDAITFSEKIVKNFIRCNINAGLTLKEKFVRQMVSTETELICLFDDLNLINIYDLKTLCLKRSNSQIIATSPRKNSFCLALDSYNALYSTDGKSIINLDYKKFESNKGIRPAIKKGENLSHIISWMSILTNSKLVLLSDAVQMENSLIFILKPISYTPTVK